VPYGQSTGTSTALSASASGHPSLPFIDELEAVVEAPAAAVYLAVAKRMARGLEAPGARAFAALLKCAHRGASYTVPPIEGQETNGFVVARADEPRALVLEGQHRFATYRLSFFVDPLTERRSCLRARTEAVFPGFGGAVYRELVIGSSGHAILVKRMLTAISREAIRSQA
jgi:hypothetical protein